MRLFGHPIHPMLVHFPIALWTVASFCDALAAIGIARAWPVAWLAVGAGTAVALLTMTAGLIDYAELEERAVGVAQRHLALMGTAWLLYAAAFVLRSNGLAPVAEPAMPAMIASWIGFVVLIAGAWQGGQLVYRLGAGIDR
jgi:uncharacterized membrane protein